MRPFSPASGVAPAGAASARTASAERTTAAAAVLFFRASPSDPRSSPNSPANAKRHEHQLQEADAGGASNRGIPEGGLSARRRGRRPARRLRRRGLVAGVLRLRPFRAGRVLLDPVVVQLAAERGLCPRVVPDPVWVGGCEPLVVHGHPHAPVVLREAEEL